MGEMTHTDVVSVAREVAETLGRAAHGGLVYEDDVILIVATSTSIEVTQKKATNPDATLHNITIATDRGESIIRHYGGKREIDGHLVYLRLLIKRALPLISQAETILRRWKREPMAANIGAIQQFLAAADPAGRAVDEVRGA